MLVIQHEDDCPPAWLGEWLASAGVALDVVHGHRGQSVPDSVRGYDGLLVLGGDMGAYDDNRCPWLTPTRRLIATTVRHHHPFLGVCLGHQLAAVALGGTVDANPAGEATGLTPVMLTAAGRADPLLSGMAQGQVAVQWNRDIVASLPPGATKLADSPDGSVQAARYGRRAWGVQFHPEVSPAVFASWTVGGPKASDGSDNRDMTAAAAAVEAAGEQLRRTWRPFAERFAEIAVASRARPDKGQADEGGRPADQTEVQARQRRGGTPPTPPTLPVP